MKKEPKLIIFSGPSGSGKTTMTNSLCYQEKLANFYPHFTTRPPRKNETNYQFINIALMEDLEKSNNVFIQTKFIENYYGCFSDFETFLYSNLSNSHNIIIDTIIPISRWRKKLDELQEIRYISIFLFAPKNILKRRLEKRNDTYKNHNNKNLRLLDAENRIKEIINHDYCIVTNNLHRDLNIAQNIIYKETGISSKHNDFRKINTIQYKVDSDYCKKLNMQFLSAI